MDLMGSARKFSGNGEREIVFMISSEKDWS